MTFAKLLSAATLMVATVAAHAAPQLYSFSAPNANPLSFYVTADDNSILGLQVVEPAFTSADLSYTPSASWINFYDGVAGQNYLVELDLAAGSTARFGVRDLVTNQAISLSAVPEPETVALALAGVLVVGLRLGRRQPVTQ